MVKVNGKELDLAGMTVSEYLATTNYDPKRIAVERNGDIVFKSQYDTTDLEDGDMWWAIFADVGVMVLAVLNATRALKAPRL